MMTVYENEILNNKLLMQNLMKFMQEGAIVLNASNDIELCNNAAVSLFGFTEEADLIGKNISAVYETPEELDEKRAFFEDTGHSDNLESSFIREDGRAFLANYSITVINDQPNSKLMRIILLRDISEQKRTREMIAEYTLSLEKNNKELDQFSYIVSHDLKAPLRAISNLSLWLQDDLGPSLSGESHGHLVMLRNRVVRMEALINGILEYSRIGRENVPSESVDVYKLLSEILELLSPPDHFTINITEPMPVVDAARIMLHEVFANLISNAIKYNDKEQGIISIYAIEKEEYFEFTVEDNGPGIPAEYHEKIFVIFQTLQSRDKYESTGIGLAIVKRILAGKGAEIRVESEAGKGSRFIFTWPK